MDDYLNEEMQYTCGTDIADLFPDMCTFIMVANGITCADEIETSYFHKGCFPLVCKFCGSNELHKDSYQEAKKTFFKVCPVCVGCHSKGFSPQKSKAIKGIKGTMPQESGNQHKRPHTATAPVSIPTPSTSTGIHGKNKSSSELCTICHQVDPADFDEDDDDDQDIDWVGCDHCSIWAHMICIPKSNWVQKIKAGEDLYYCDKCDY